MNVLFELFLLILWKCKSRERGVY